MASLAIATLESVLEIVPSGYFQVAVSVRPLAPPPSPGPAGLELYILPC